MKLRIGPAGLGSVKEAPERLEKYHGLGFRACEIAFTYGVYIKNDEDAKKIGKKAKELDIWLSIHAPYYINLNSSEKEKVEASKKRILDCCRVGELMGARTVVFHPGYYSKDKEESYETIKNQVKEIMKEIERKKWKITISPETMGRVNVFGSLDEIERLVKETGCGFCIDFAHILAREKKVNYEAVEKSFKHEKWQCHFSGIIYGEKGEKRHRTTEAGEWKNLLMGLPKGKEIVIINESPTMMEDCKEGLKIARSLGLA